MITPPRYKTARRLGASIYEKTQTPKYSLRTQRKSSRKEFNRPKTEYGMKILEKQRIKYSYGISEKQFSNYVQKINKSHSANRSEMLYRMLESRIDNVIFRSGLAPSRQSSRQMVSHGHIMVNGKRVNIPSYAVTLKDSLSIKPSSSTKLIFSNIEEKLKDFSTPTWLNFDTKKLLINMREHPKSDQTEVYNTLGSILDFYKK